MELRFVLQTLFEIAVAAFIIYGLFFEERFADAERKVLHFLKRFKLARVEHNTPSDLF